MLDVTNEKRFCFREASGHALLHEISTSFSRRLLLNIQDNYFCVLFGDAQRGSYR